MSTSATPVFLTAEWRKLVMANYAVDPSLLRDHLPHGTELDLFNDTCYVSLVGFMFLHTRLKGIRVPFHSDFEEVNLRFYVRHRTAEGWRRGVVFIREFVPKPALTFVARTLYSEPYSTVPMDHVHQLEGDRLHVQYRWKKERWHSLSVEASPTAIEMLPGSAEEFFTEHYWGYTRLGADRTAEYAVEHPRWQVYPVQRYTIDVDFGVCYGTKFDGLNLEQPRSVLLAEGSGITVRRGSRIA